MSSWPSAELGTIAEVSMGQSPPGDTYNDDNHGLPFFQGKADFGHRFPTVRKWCAQPKRIAEAGDILLSVRAPVGPTNVAEERCCIGRGLAAIRARADRIEQEYLRFFFNYQEDVLAWRGQRSTFAAIGRRDIEGLEVPLPPLSEQRQIVALLDQAERLRRLRTDADTNADRILPVLFLKMFGDPDTNPMGWPSGTLGDVVLSTHYGTSARPNTNRAGVPVLRMNNIRASGELDLRDIKFVDLDERDVQRYRLEPGDILFNRTNSEYLVGKTGMWEDGGRSAVVASYIIRVRVDRSKALPEFVWALMNSRSMKTLLPRRARRAAGMANINATEFRGLPVLLPPLHRQSEFVALAIRLRRLVCHQRRSLAAMDRLFRHLMAAAFSGALTAAWRNSRAGRSETAP